MRRSLWAVVAAGLMLGGVTTVRADVWDLDTLDEDDGPGTDNVLTHGIIQVHDLAAEASVVDQDWYFVATQPFSSYEVLLDGVTGDLWSSPLPLDLVGADGSTVVASGISLPNSIAATRTMRWQNTTSTAADNFVRVTGSGSSCTTACTTQDQYTVRFWETSASVARYNNAGSQVTILLLQNPAAYDINGRIFYWTSLGTLAGSQPFSLTPKQLLAIATAGTAGTTSGSITITQDGRFGDLQGKSVALEPSTGFSFDTPLVYRPH